LIHYKDGDWRAEVGWQYEAPIQLGICRNKDIADHYYGAAESGQICQNIYFMALSLNMGTVATGQWPPAIEPLGIPDNEEGVLVMPLGHLLYPYNFVYRPQWISKFPRIKCSGMSLVDAIKQRAETTTYSGVITAQQESQLLWASYGYSYYVDKSDNVIGRLDRHRSIPSAHGYYPNDMYIVKECGIYRYFPNFYNPIYGILRNVWFLPVIPFTIQVNSGDFRSEIAEASSEPTIATSPLIIIHVLDERKSGRPYDDLSGEQNRWLWYHDAGGSSQNILLEATAQNLTGNIVFPEDLSTFGTLLRLNSNQIPLIINPISQ
jgi:nitroreductase